MNTKNSDMNMVRASASPVKAKKKLKANAINNQFSVSQAGFGLNTHQPQIKPKAVEVEEALIN